MKRAYLQCSNVLLLIFRWLTYHASHMPYYQARQVYIVDSWFEFQPLLRSRPEIFVETCMVRTQNCIKLIVAFSENRFYQNFYKWES